MSARSVGTALVVAAVLLVPACTSSSSKAKGAGQQSTASVRGATVTRLRPHVIPARFRGATSALYSKEENWLCKPGADEARCVANLDSTIVNADGSTKIVKHKVVRNAPVDCFYVYPTVNFTPGGGNDLAMANDTGSEVGVVRIQAGRFSEMCNLYAPLYRQQNLSGFSSPDRAQAAALAYGDVKDAFAYYMAHYNNGRPFVLIGHSQGSIHLAHLLQDEFDNDPALRSQMVSALLIGGTTRVPRGKDVGGTFKHIPLCRSATQTSCVVAYNSYGTNPPPGAGSFFEGGACVNPAAPRGGSGVLDPYVPAGNIGGVPTVTTPWVQLPGTMTAECTKQGGRTFLGISAAAKPGDPRDVAPLVVNVPGWGLHITEFGLTLGSLLPLVRTEIATLR